MNLYFRLIYILFKTLFSIKIKALDPSQLIFRALPTDCDLNLHITNSRYLSFMDLGRTYLIGQLGLLKPLYQRRWGPVIQATELTYLKPIMIGQRFKLTTRMIYWDSKYFYMEQRFTLHDQLYMQATVKGLFIGGKNKIPTSDIVALFPDHINSPTMPAFLQHWQSLLAAKKNNS